MIHQPRSRNSRSPTNTRNGSHVLSEEDPCGDNNDSGHSSDEDTFLDQIDSRHSLNTSDRLKSKLSSDSLFSLKSECTVDDNEELLDQLVSSNFDGEMSRESHNNLPDGSVLGLVLKSQYSSLSVVEAYHSYNRLKSRFSSEEVKSMLCGPIHKCDDSIESISTSLKKVENGTFPLCDKTTPSDYCYSNTDNASTPKENLRLPELDSNPHQTIVESEIPQKVDDLREFLRTLTFRDCSLMLLISGPVTG